MNGAAQTADLPDRRDRSGGNRAGDPAAFHGNEPERLAPGGDFLGRGWHWPVTTDPTGAFAMTTGVAEVEQAMYLILSTTPGERPMRPEFGCPLVDYVFAPADATTAGLISYEVVRAITRWEPRVDVVDVTVTPDPDAATLWIDIAYRLRDDYDRRNLVVPFYVIPDDEAA